MRKLFAGLAVAAALVVGAGQHSWQGKHDQAGLTWTQVVHAAPAAK
jgi:hypothetical protein